MSDERTTSQTYTSKRTQPAIRTLRIAALGATAAVLIGSAQLAYANPFQHPGRATASSPPACTSERPPTPPSPAPTTLTTIQQAYECILTNYYSGHTLDDRTLLTGAFASLTTELQRRDLDQATATLPRLTGKHDSDWAAFANTYQKLLTALPNDAHLRETLAIATMQGMIDSLHDNHNGLGLSKTPSMLGLEYTFEGRPAADVPPKDIRDSTGPMYITSVMPETPAATAGLKPGDIIEGVDGVPVFIQGKLTAGDLDLLSPQSEQDIVKITVHRPSTDKTWTIELHPAHLPAPTPPTPSVKLLDRGIVYVQYPSFDANTADQVLKKVADLRTSTSLRGIILDVRSNAGGGADAVAKLLGAFAHGKVWSRDCDANNHCTPNSTDDSVALLNLPLVVLTDGRCASACDAFAAAVKDLRLGKLVGARTAGVASGLPVAYLLNNGQVLGLTPTHQVAANGENVNDIGVAVDYQAPMTARDLSNGRDPGLEKALTLLPA